MDEVYIARPTELYVSYLAAKHNESEAKARRVMTTGRLSLACEIITVMKTLEGVALSAEYEHTISVLQTLLVDQHLLEPAMAMYAALNEWRKPKFRVLHGAGDPDADASSDASQPRDEPQP